MDEQTTLAQRIRSFFHDLFGSRLLQRLEYDLLDIRTAYEQRLNERDETIADLREQLSQVRGKLEVYETVLLPISSSVGKLFSPKPAATFETVIGPTPGSWAAVQQDWYAQQEAEIVKEKLDGLRVERREEVEQQIQS
jgi:hypothetical protein